MYAGIVVDILLDLGVGASKLEQVYVRAGFLHHVFELAAPIFVDEMRDRPSGTMSLLSKMMVWQAVPKTG